MRKMPKFQKFSATLTLKVTLPSVCMCVSVTQSCPTLCNFMDCETPLSMGFSRQEYWSGLSFLPSGVLSNPGTTSAIFLFQTIRWSFSLSPLTFSFMFIIAITLVAWVVVPGIHVYLYFYDLSLFV